MSKSSNPIADFFDYTWKYIWPVLIEAAVIGIAFLFAFFDLHIKMTDWVGNVVNWLGKWFDGLSNKFWAMAICEWAMSWAEGTFFGDVLLFVPKILTVIVGFVLALVAQGIVFLLAAVVAFVILLLVVIFVYVIVFGIMFVFPAAAALFAIINTVHLRKTEGVELPVVEGILFGIFDVVIAIGGPVMYFLYLANIL